MEDYLFSSLNPWLLRFLAVLSVGLVDIAGARYAWSKRKQLKSSEVYGRLPSVIDDLDKPTADGPGHGEFLPEDVHPSEAEEVFFRDARDFERTQLEENVPSLTLSNDAI